MPDNLPVVRKIAAWVPMPAPREIPDVICGATAEYCHCILPPGHDGPHGCDPDRCGGAWTGDIDGDDFTIVSLPGGGPAGSILGLYGF